MQNPVYLVRFTPPAHIRHLPPAQVMELIAAFFRTRMDELQDAELLQGLQIVENPRLLSFSVQGPLPACLRLAEHLKINRLGKMTTDESISVS